MGSPGYSGFYPAKYKCVVPSLFGSLLGSPRTALYLGLFTAQAAAGQPGGKCTALSRLCTLCRVTPPHRCARQPGSF